MGYLPCSALQALYAISAQDTSAEWNHVSEIAEQIGYRRGSDHNEPYSGAITYMVNYMGPFIRRREIVSTSSIVYDTVRQCYLLMGKTTTALTDDIDPSNTLDQVKTKNRSKFMYVINGFTFYEVSCFM